MGAATYESQIDAMLIRSRVWPLEHLKYQLQLFIIKNSHLNFYPFHLLLSLSLWLPVYWSYKQCVAYVKAQQKKDICPLMIQKLICCNIVYARLSLTWLFKVCTDSWFARIGRWCLIHKLCCKTEQKQWFMLGAWCHFCLELERNTKTTYLKLHQFTPASVRFEVWRKYSLMTNTVSSPGLKLTTPKHDWGVR